MSAEIVWFEEVGLGDRERVGGKGASLGELTRAGVAVPAGFIITTPAFESFIAALEAEAPLRAVVAALDPHDLTAVSAATAALRARIEAAPWPDGLQIALLEGLRRLCAGHTASPVAIRSSATAEDSEDASFAGLQDTYLWVLGAQSVLRMVRRCWSSLYSVESVCYRRTHGIDEREIAMAVVVQRMIDARAAGVMFTRSPTTGDRSVITVEGAYGLGSTVVSGEVTPDRWTLSKITSEITSRTISEKHIQHVPAVSGGINEEAVSEALRGAPCLSDDELQALKSLGLKVERHYRRPQDIEWAIAHDTSEIYLLQSRPETVWAARDNVPVARPAASAVAHVMTIFGGRR